MNVGYEPIVLMPAVYSLQQQEIIIKLWLTVAHDKAVRTQLSVASAIKKEKHKTVSKNSFATRTAFWAISLVLWFWGDQSPTFMDCTAKFVPRVQKKEVRSTFYKEIWGSTVGWLSGSIQAVNVPGSLFAISSPNSDKCPTSMADHAVNQDKCQETKCIRKSKPVHLFFCAICK